jgi:hypothetical protein
MDYEMSRLRMDFVVGALRLAISFWFAVDNVFIFPLYTAIQRNAHHDNLVLLLFLNKVAQTAYPDHFCIYNT